ncbi:Putative DNA-3-methyladenine glycosylase YfjP [Psilocybe cubensis]|uniref:DNA-3-methyladenine glycosylase YfjP n=1 Tax=Psilocybe cubensis TaxID=181762 RepID=A0ACB8HC59_PSICU|nr:Putative DNA-3-methyladenine glycosylase YfjP [Psilocybe cubensis]KAH9485409.1 Putative DNA-3-methyladenine glycosylase YfjP [Psilocybe cubensis]
MPIIRRSSTRLASKLTARDVSVQPMPSGDTVDTKNTRNLKARPRNATYRPDALREELESTANLPEIGQKVSPALPIVPKPSSEEEEEEVVFVPAVLSFDLEEAKRHLIQIDQRFEELFTKMKCKPFEHLEQVANTDVSILRTAGLSARKAEYIRDLAVRFADGRLSTRKLLEANDDELAEMLIEVRGIGRYPSTKTLTLLIAVDMFAIFSLRRPDILPVGDLGVQRGVVRWFLSLHSPAHTYTLSPEKLGGTGTATKKNKGKKGKARIAANEEENTASTVPGVSYEAEDLPSIPPAFTPSIKKTLNKVGGAVVPLPSGMDVEVLKARLDPKNKIKGAFVTPQEMADLTACWRPYRSIAVYYMWSLADVLDLGSG